MTDLSAPKKETLSDRIFDEMKSKIASGEWAPGDRIPSENKLCVQTGASRVSVRSAIGKLAGLGLVESRQGGGTYVCRLSGEESLNAVLPYLMLSPLDRKSIFEFREIFEVKSAGLAAQRALPEQIKALHQYAQQMASSDNEADISQNDFAFHRQIMEASQNPLLLKIFDILEDCYSTMMHDNAALLGASGALMHQQIANAIQENDPTRAEQLMHQHLNDTYSQLP